MLSHSVYVGGINNLSDARYAAGMFVDQIGIPIGGDQGISLDKFTELTQWLSGVNIVAQLHGIPDFSLDSLSASAFEVADKALFLWVKQNSDLPVGWRGPLHQVHDVPDDVAFHVVEGATLNDIEKHPQVYWEISEELQQQRVWEKFPGMKLALQGGDEQRPGFSDFGDLMDILEALELD